MPSTPKAVRVRTADGWQDIAIVGPPGQPGPGAAGRYVADSFPTLPGNAFTRVPLKIDPTAGSSPQPVAGGMTLSADKMFVIIPMDGWYSIDGYMQINGPASAVSIYCDIYVTGSMGPGGTGDYSLVREGHATVPASSLLRMSPSTKAYLRAGDKVSILGYCSGAGGGFFATTLTIASMGGPQGIVPERVGAIAKTITDWNAATENGWYMGAGVANAPDTGWWIGQVTVHNQLWIQQEVWAFTESNPQNSRRRTLNNGVWQPWVAVMPPDMFKVTQRRDGPDGTRGYTGLFEPFLWASADLRQSIVAQAKIWWQTRLTVLVQCIDAAWYSSDGYWASDLGSGPDVLGHTDSTRTRVSNHNAVPWHTCIMTAKWKLNAGQSFTVRPLLNGQGNWQMHCSPTWCMVESYVVGYW
jgi:hypothetical protein